MAELVENPLKQTIPFDPRFPNQNQTRNCWQNYVDFHRCQKLKVCFYFLFFFDGMKQIKLFNLFLQLQTVL